MERTSKAGSAFEIKKVTTMLREDRSDEIDIVPVVKNITANTRKANKAVWGVRNMKIAKAVATPFPPLNFK